MSVSVILALCVILASGAVIPSTVSQSLVLSGDTFLDHDVLFTGAGQLIMPDTLTIDTNVTLTARDMTSPIIISSNAVVIRNARLVLEFSAPLPPTVQFLTVIERSAGSPVVNGSFSETLAFQINNPCASLATAVQLTPSAYQIGVASDQKTCAPTAATNTVIPQSTTTTTATKTAAATTAMATMPVRGHATTNSCAWRLLLVSITAAVIFAV